MAEKEISPFSNPGIMPTEELLKEVLGEKYGWFWEIIQQVHDKHKQVTVNWKYYNDGKQWLFRMLYRKKTIFWILVLPGTFRITFYFSGKSESSVLSANLPESVKKAYTETRGNTFRAISLRLHDPDDIKLACQLCDLKIHTG